MRIFTRRFQIALTAFLVFGLLLLSAPPGHARGHGHGGRHGHGGGHRRHFHHGPRGLVVIGVAPWWWGPYWYYQYEGSSEPLVYIQRPPAQSYWYYCPRSRAYYPTVPSCAEPWIPVPPRSLPAL